MQVQMIWYIKKNGDKKKKEKQQSSLVRSINLHKNSERHQGWNKNLIFEFFNACFFCFVENEKCCVFKLPILLINSWFRFYYIFLDIDCKSKKKDFQSTEIIKSTGSFISMLY